jgi:hypothetical protein
MPMTRDEWFKWAVGICGGVATAIILGVGAFVWRGLDAYIDDRAEAVAKKTFANGGVAPSEMEEVKELVSSAIARMDAADSDREDIKEDLRNVYRILTDA